MRFLHTSDWHLGHCLYGKKRYEEFNSFFTWLLKTIDEQRIDTLIVAGDIFDNTTPSNKVTELYYDFLAKIRYTCCKNVIITAGNHDSPTFLDTSKSILKVLNVHVIGTIRENLEEEVITLYNQDKTPGAIIMAVPFLRERDIRLMHQDESIAQGNKNLREAILDHYKKVYEIAQCKQSEYQQTNKYIPIIATGHLVLTGSLTIKDKQARDIYIGTLVNIDANDFPSDIDYLALGHIHVPQLVGGKENVRYCGTPYPMSFGEANQQKIVVILDSDTAPLNITTLNVPVFQKLVVLKGDVDELKSGLKDLVAKDSRIYVEAHYTGDETILDLSEQLHLIVENTNVFVLKVDNPPVLKKYTLKKSFASENIEDLKPVDVFQRLLSDNSIQDPKAQRLTALFNKLVNDMNEVDKRAE